MPIFDNINQTTSQGVAPGVVQYYERTLIQNVQPDMVHSRDAQKRALPEHNGKYVQFRRMIPYEASITPLTEGVTPDGQEIRQAAFSVMVKPYGRHVEMTDELNYFQLDNMHQEVAKLLSDQALLSLDTIARNALHTGMNVQYVNGKTSRAAINGEDKLTPFEVKKAVRTLRRNNCKPFADGFYHAIVHPDAVYDLTDDPLWIDVAKYQAKENIERGELGCLHKVKFFESTNAMVYGGEETLCGSISALTVESVGSDGRSAVFAETITPAEARELTGKLVLCGDALACVERVEAENKTIFFRWKPEGLAQGVQMTPYGAGADGVKVLGTLIYGQDAFGDVELGGAGKNVRIIINPPGSSGAADPLEQRGSIAWKVRGYACAILQDSFIVRVEHSASV